MVNSPRNRKKMQQAELPLGWSTGSCKRAITSASVHCQGQFLNSFPLRIQYCHLLSILILAFVLPLTFKILFNWGSFSRKTNIFVKDLGCKLYSFFFMFGKVLFTLISGLPSAATSLLSYIIANLVPCGLLFYH